MSLIRPFRGLRPLPELAAEIASPPYDVIDSAEAREMAKGKEKSFLHVVKPEIDLDPSVDLYSDAVYQQAVDNLAMFQEKGWLKQDEKSCIYLYRQKMGEHVQTGLVACVSVDEYQQDLIKKHELTRQSKEDDRTRHVSDTDCNAGPVFLTYDAQEAIDKMVAEHTQKEPAYDFVADDGIGHTFWVVEDSAAIEEYVSNFAKVPCMYVADGHHRTASGGRVRELRKEKNPNHTGQEEYNFFMAVLFPHNQLKILDYNRAVKDLKGMTSSGFMAKVMEKFDVAPSSDGKPTKSHEFGMYIDGAWHKLTAKEGTYDANDPVKKLDVSILQENLLAPLLGIEDPRTDERIKFIGGIRGLGELEKLVGSGDYAVAFAMYPTSIRELMDIADAGAIMPPKSTWFEPKLRSGLIVHLLS